MAEEFISGPSNFVQLNSEPPDPHQQCLRMLLIGPPSWVSETILDLHSRGFANATGWSNLLPTPNPGEAMSIHTWRRRQHQ